MIKRITIQGVNINHYHENSQKHFNLYELHISLISDTIEIIAHN